LFGTLRSISLAVIVCVVLSGCVGLMPSPFRPSPGPRLTPDTQDLAQAFDIVCRNYRVGPDDILRVLYQTEWSVPPGSFRLDTLDEVSIDFILDPQLNVSRTINPDGMITLPGIGDIQAAGLTREELAGRIEKAYRRAGIFAQDETEPESKKYKLVTVTVNKFYQKVGELVKSLTTLTGGQQTQITVNPDGTLDFPLLKDRILAAGYTVREIEDTVNRLYRAGALEHVVVSVALQQAQSRKVYVLGQVKNPGAYTLTQPISALHAIALAGGHIPETADLTSVILISKDVHGKPIGRRLDLKKILDVGDMSSAILVKPYDVLYVPKTYVRDLRLFMAQYVQTVADFASLVNLLKGTSTSSILFPF
jgi:polysaccharide export outer membrane protein